MEKHLGGEGKAEGNILIVRLALGATAGNLIFDEYKKMLDRNPGLKVVGEVEGQATRSVAQRNVAQSLDLLARGKIRYPRLGSQFDLADAPEVFAGIAAKPSSVHKAAFVQSRS